MSLIIVINTLNNQNSWIKNPMQLQFMQENINQMKSTGSLHVPLYSLTEPFRDTQYKNEFNFSSFY